jgi:hypothetical protein
MSIDPATVVRVPADAPMHEGRERPVTVSFGWKHPAVATYANGRTITADDQFSLALLREVVLVGRVRVRTDA